MIESIRWRARNSKEVNDAPARIDIIFLFSLLLRPLYWKGMLKRSGVENNQRPPTAVETMMYINVYSLSMMIPLAVLSGQMGEGIRLLQNSEQLRMNVAILTGVVSFGQIFIFLCIDWYSSLVTTTITTTRKFFTILFSVLYFGHTFTVGQWTSVFMVFFGLYLSIASGNKPEAKKKVE